MTKDGNIWGEDKIKTRMKKARGAFAALKEEEKDQQENKDKQIQEQCTKGLCKDFFSPKIRDYYGSGWVGPGLTRIFWENRPKIALNQYRCFRVVYHVYSVCTYIAKSCWFL